MAPSTRPNEYTIAGAAMLFSGLSTLLLSLLWILLLGWMCIGLFWLVPFTAAIFEIVVAVQILNGKPQHNAAVVAIVGLIGALLTFNWMGVASEAVAASLLFGPNVRGWLEQHHEGPRGDW